MSTTVIAERFGSNGKRIEIVEINVNHVGASVFLAFKGQGPAKHFILSPEAWRELIREQA